MTTVKKNNKKSTKVESQDNNNTDQSMDSKTYYRFIRSVDTRISSDKLEENDGINLIMYVLLGENTPESFGKAAQWLTNYRANEYKRMVQRTQEELAASEKK